MQRDPLDTCPYDPVHRILRSRMQFHLTRCAKNFPDSKKKQCPYDTRHVVNQVEYNYHVSTCPARESVWHYKINDIETPVQPKILPVEVDPVPAEENWEEDTEVKSYNPLQNIQERPIVRTLMCASKAKRRQFRMEERRRIQQLDDGIQKQTKLQEAAAYAANNAAKNSQQSNAAAGSSRDSFEQNEQEYKPLRRPKKLPPDSLNNTNLSTINESTISNENEQSIMQNSNSLAQGQQKTKENGQSTMQNLNSFVRDQQKANEKSTMQNLNSLVGDQKSSNATSASTSSNGSIPKNAQQNSSCVAAEKSQPATKTVPFSYAAALNRTKARSMNNTMNTTIGSEYDVVIEDIKIDNEKENFNNSSFFNRSADDSIVEKLSKTVDELALDDEGHKKKTEPLNKQIQLLKNIQKAKAASSSNNNNGMNTRCAASFPTLK